MEFNLVDFLHRNFGFSTLIFGPGDRASGVVDHIRKELNEIQNDPNDLEEWVDVLFLAFDGAMRQGFTPKQIIATMEYKYKKNCNRDWPDWRTVDTSKAIEHIRD